jgi:hypothetical protein
MEKAALFTAWVSIIGGAFAYLNVIFALLAFGGDQAGQLYGATMLALPHDTRDLFRWSMLCDVLGFYLPFLVIGGYVWHAFRDEGGPLVTAAVAGLVFYVTVGAAGAAMQLAALEPLAQLHAGGGDSVKAATEAVWTGLAHASQSGLWWLEGPVMLFVAFVIGNLLKRAGWGFPILLQISGVCFGLFFLFGLFSELDGLGELAETVVVLLTPLWMILLGWQLLRRARVRTAEG